MPLIGVPLSVARLLIDRLRVLQLIARLLQVESLLAALAFVSISRRDEQARRLTTTDNLAQNHTTRGHCFSSNGAAAQHAAEARIAASSKSKGKSNSNS